MNAQKPATLGDLICGQDPRMEISKLRGEISILKEELQRVKTTAEREKERADAHSDCFLDMQKELEATIKQRDELISRQQSASALPLAEREQKELMHSRKMATIYDDPKGIDAILAERKKTHGSFSVHAECTQTLEDTFYSYKDCSFFTAVQLEALHMIFHKLGRIAAGSPHFQDHWDDIAGYATLVSRDISSREAKAKGKGR